MERRRQATEDREPRSDAARGDGSSRARGSHVERAGRRPAGGTGGSAGAEQPDDFHAQRQSLGRSEHHHGREPVLGGDSTAEGRECNGNRGVSAKQGGGVMRVLRGKAAERAVAQIEKRSSRLDEVEPKVRRIIHSVRKGGDKAVARYATLWDN